MRPLLVASSSTTDVNILNESLAGNSESGVPHRLGDNCDTVTQIKKGFCYVRFPTPICMYTHATNMSVASWIYEVFSSSSRSNKTSSLEVVVISLSYYYLLLSPIILVINPSRQKLHLLVVYYFYFFIGTTVCEIKRN